MTEPGSTPDDPVRDMLRRLRVFDTDLPRFQPDQTPADPLALFTEWLAAAIMAGVPEPHVMSLATSDADGHPSSRMLICRGVDPPGRWFFASSSTSRKGRELAACPHAALGFYWPRQGRQIRIRGQATAESAERSAADFLARSTESRVEGLVGHQSAILADPADQPAAITEARARIAADPDLVAPDWTLYGLLAEEVEFWQGDRDRQHIRLRYHRTGGEHTGRQWAKERLWP
jgi:pyridoxamine 5'-phosphate oxidase